VTSNGVLKLMQGLNPHKAPGPDSISSQFLREMAHPLAPALALVEDRYRMIGTQPTSHPSTRRATKARHQTTDLSPLPPSPVNF